MHLGSDFRLILVRCEAVKAATPVLRTVAPSPRPALGLALMPYRAADTTFALAGRAPSSGFVGGAQTSAVHPSQRLRVPCGYDRSVSAYRELFPRNLNVLKPWCPSDWPTPVLKFCWTLAGRTTVFDVAPSDARSLCSCWTASLKLLFPHLIVETGSQSQLISKKDLQTQVVPVIAAVTIDLKELHTATLHLL